jgi:hypothetical protein
MSRKYKFGEKTGAYFISFATVYWIDIFTRDEYFANIPQLFEVFLSNAAQMSPTLRHFKFFKNPISVKVSDFKPKLLQIVLCK